MWDYSSGPRFNSIKSESLRVSLQIHREGSLFSVPLFNRNHACLYSTRRRQNPLPSRAPDSVPIGVYRTSWMMNLAAPHPQGCQIINFLNKFHQDPIEYASGRLGEGDGRKQCVWKSSTRTTRGCACDHLAFQLRRQCDTWYRSCLLRDSSPSKGLPLEKASVTCK